MILKLNIYDKKGKEIVRTAEGQTCDIMLGTIEGIMEVLNIDSVEDDFEIIKRIYGAYQEIRIILGDVFGEVTEEEWRRVKVKELIPVILAIAKFTFFEMKKIPTDPN